jgi:SET domain-containing protein
MKGFVMKQQYSHHVYSSILSPHVFTAFDIDPKEINSISGSMRLPEFSFFLKKLSSSGKIGIFAARYIPKGSLLFNSNFTISILNKEDIPAESLPYCVYLNNVECSCPEYFNRRSIDWYINHSSQKPNTVKESSNYTDEELDVFNARFFIAIQDIKAGDEILINRKELSQ